MILTVFLSSTDMENSALSMCIWNMELLSEGAAIIRNINPPLIR